MKAGRRHPHLARSLALAASIAAGILLPACGGGDGNDTSTTGSPDSTPVTKPSTDGPVRVTKPPASADDTRPQVPDDVISERPGGPNDQSGGK